MSDAAMQQLAIAREALSEIRGIFHGQRIDPAPSIRVIISRVLDGEKPDTLPDFRAAPDVGFEPIYPIVDSLREFVRGGSLEICVDDAIAFLEAWGHLSPCQRTEGLGA